MAHLVFLDTEFTQFINVELLSLGMVTLADATRELYVELDMSTAIGRARRKASSDFVKYEGVLDQWGVVPGATATNWEMGRRAGEWLLGLAEESGSRLEVAFDYGTDFELLEYAVRDSGLWDRVREIVWPVNVGALTGTIHGQHAADDCYRAIKKRGLNRHHALADALALRTAYAATKDTTLRLASFSATEGFKRLVAAAEAGAACIRRREPARFDATTWSAPGWVRQWLTDESPRLGGRSPLDILEGENGADHLKEAIRAMARGVFL